MTTKNVSKLKVTDPAHLHELIALPAAAAELVRGGSETEMLERLVASGFALEATKLIAHGLPKREAVWWACMCAVHTAEGESGSPEGKAIAAAEHWVRTQTDDARRAAFAAAAEAGFDSPGAWAAVAAFWSGDSMAPQGQPAVPPAAHLTGTAVAGAVALAAVRQHPERREGRLKRFIESGRDIAAGGPGRLPPEEA